MVGGRDDLEVVEICYYYQKRDVGKPFISAFARQVTFFENVAMLPCPAFVLLCMIGANMLKEAFGKEEECVDAALDFKTMVVLA
ncbi:MAG: hypothetical protein IIW61_03220, partial [Bacteroidaceae bacterium]|nr:hypothetical protein [Bacteroidaceae bacterium]